MMHAIRQTSQSILGTAIYAVLLCVLVLQSWLVGACPMISGTANVASLSAASIESSMNHEVMDHSMHDMHADHMMSRAISETMSMDSGQSECADTEASCPMLALLHAHHDAIKWMPPSIAAQAIFIESSTHATQQRPSSLYRPPIRSVS